MDVKKEEEEKKFQAGVRKVIGGMRYDNPWTLHGPIPWDRWANAFYRTSDDGDHGHDDRPGGRDASSLLDLLVFFGWWMQNRSRQYGSFELMLLIDTLVERVVSRHCHGVPWEEEIGLVDKVNPSPSPRLAEKKGWGSFVDASSTGSV